MKDFDKVRLGDVLVILFSDVNWTPLFVKARVVVIESGGILFHASILAREYGIPAVVSVQGIMALKDQSIVAIDGTSGKITVLQSKS